VILFLLDLIGLNVTKFKENEKYENVRVGWGFLIYCCGLYVLLFVDLGFQPWLNNDKIDVQDVSDMCNPNSERGCEFDMKSSVEHHSISNMNSEGYSVNYHTPIVNDQVVSGGVYFKKIGREKFFLNFPSKYSPYQFSFWKGKILLKGILNDFKFDKKLGWFSEDKFKVHQWIDGGCAFTHCIDKHGVEIYNVDYEVVFSFSKTDSDSYRFAGSYENNERYFVSNGEIEQIFATKEKAIEFRSAIPYLFDYTNNCKRLILPDL